MSFKNEKDEIEEVDQVIAVTANGIVIYNAKTEQILLQDFL